MLVVRSTQAPPQFVSSSAQLSELVAPTAEHQRRLHARLADVAQTLASIERDGQYAIKEHIAQHASRAQLVLMDYKVLCVLTQMKEGEAERK